MARTALLAAGVAASDLMKEKPEQRQHREKKSQGMSKNVKFTISLSPKSVEILEELKEVTDAATDSEAFRNALRLHLTLIRAHLDGKQLLVKDKQSGDVAAIPVTLFAAV
jgi:hypothetical protein